jgi:hypothetical protein
MGSSTSAGRQRLALATPHMLPSTVLSVSAPTTLEISRLNSPPHAMVVYASQPPSPTTPQHSLPGVRYDLPGPDFHRLDSASLPDAQGRSSGRESAPTRRLAMPCIAAQDGWRSSLSPSLGATDGQGRSNPLKRLDSRKQSAWIFLPPIFVFLLSGLGISYSGSICNNKRTPAA